MRILVVAERFAEPGGSPWLIDDLADELARSGHEVDVLVIDPTGAHPRGTRSTAGPGALRIHSSGSTRRRRGTVAKLLGYIGTFARAHGDGARFATGPYDLAIYTTIAAFAFGLPGRLRRRGSVRRLTLVLWDFFPIHQFEIGRIRGTGMRAVLRLIERRAIRPADTIAVMTPANRDFLRRYHPSVRARTVIVPPWAAIEARPDDDERWSAERLAVVFGGQLARGRGVETLLDAAALLRDDPIDIAVLGDGPLRAEHEARASELRLSTVRFTGALPRAEYRSRVRSAHVGVAITVAGVTPPSFPSKIVEYAGLGLAVVVAVEGSSDAGALVEQHGAGVTVPAGDPAALAAALRSLVVELREGSLARRAQAARTYYESELSVRHAAVALAGTAS